MSESRPFEFRSPHGVRKVEHRSRCWNRITVRHVVQHLDAGRVWHDISAPELTVAVVLEQKGGYCEPRFNVNRPTPRNRFDAGHTVFVPPDMTIWGYSDSIRRTRDDPGTPEVSRFSCMLFLSVRRFSDYAGPAGRSRPSQPTVLPSSLRQRVRILFIRFSKLNSPAH